MKVGLGLLFVGEAVRGEHDAYASDAMAGPGARSASDAASIGRLRISSSSMEIRGISSE